MSMAWFTASVTMYTKTFFSIFFWILSLFLGCFHSLPDILRNLAGYQVYLYLILLCCTMTDVSGRGMTEKSFIRLTSWNVKGLNGPIKRSRIFSHLKCLNSDIIFLQETHLLNSHHLRLKNPWVWHIFHSKFNAKVRGTAILIHKKN